MVSFSSSIRAFTATKSQNVCVADKISLDLLKQQLHFQLNILKKKSDFTKHAIQIIFIHDNDNILYLGNSSLKNWKVHYC